MSGRSLEDKIQEFGNAVNITLGLPIIRTSVDHGTALDLAATGKANTGSLKKAIDSAIELCFSAQKIPLISTSEGFTCN